MGIPTNDSLVSLNRPYVFNGWYPLGFIDQFIRKIPFQRIDQPTTQVGWNTADPSLITVPVFAQDDNVDLSAQDFSQTQMTLQRIGATALVDSLSQASSGNTNSLLDAEIQAKKIAIIRTLGAQIISGDGLTNNFNGLKAEIEASQEFSLSALAGAGLPDHRDLLRLINMVRCSDGSVGGGADCIVTHEQVIRYIINDLADHGLVCATVYDADLGVSVPLFRGIPMYAGQVPLISGKYDIWALKLSGPTGIRVLHATGQSSQFGIEVTPVPMQSVKSQIGAFVGGLYGLMVPEPQSIARIQGVSESDMESNGTLPLPT